MLPDDMRSLQVWADLLSAVCLQAVYIAELEEENLNLKERMFLLEQQLRESRQGQAQAAQQTGSSENSASESDQCEQEEPQAEEEEEEGAIL